MLKWLEQAQNTGRKKNQSLLGLKLSWDILVKHPRSLNSQCQKPNNQEEEENTMDVVSDSREYSAQLIPIFFFFK